MSVKEEIDGLILNQPQQVRAYMLSPERWAVFCQEIGVGPNEAFVRYRGYAAGRPDAPAVLVVERWDA